MHMKNDSKKQALKKREKEQNDDLLLQGYPGAR